MLGSAFWSQGIKIYFFFLLSLSLSLSLHKMTATLVKDQYSVLFSGNGSGMQIRLPEVIMTKEQLLGLQTNETDDWPGPLGSFREEYGKVILSLSIDKGYRYPIIEVTFTLEQKGDTPWKLCDGKFVIPALGLSNTIERLLESGGSLTKSASGTVQMEQIKRIVV